ncbi:MAG: uncharacterized protein JWP91_603 [Fibrobacteres bacterium]|nr:uncharacterized protein [Fibrobacterota bacterium]
MKILNSWMIASMMAGLALNEARAHGSDGNGMEGKAIAIFAGPVNNFPELKGVDVKTRVGTAIGVLAEWGVHGNYGLALEPMLNFGGPSVTNGAGYEPDLMVLEIPILLRRNFLFREHNRLFVFAGPNLSFPLSAEGDIAANTALKKDNLKAFEFLMDVGLGGTVRIVEYWHLMGNVRYTHGFTDVLEDPIGGVDEWKSRNVKFLFGIMHHIPGT